MVRTCCKLEPRAEEFKVYLLLGTPHREQLREAFSTAENILNKMPCKHDFFREEDAEDFADLVKKEIAYNHSVN